MNFLPPTPRSLRSLLPSTERAFAGFAFRAARIFSALLLCFCAPARGGDNSPNIIYVDQTATGQNDGTSWEDAFTSLAEALHSTRAGDEVWVAEGLYFPEGGEPFQVQGIALRGGFAGTEKSPDDRTPGAHPTRLSCDLAQDDVGDFDNPSRQENCPILVEITYRQGLRFSIVEDFELTGAGSAGIEASERAIIRRCSISRVGHGVRSEYAGERGFRIENCEITDAEHDGIKVFASGLVLRNTRIDRVGGYGVELVEQYDSFIEGCAITRCFSAGVDSHPGGRDVLTVIANSTITSTDSWSLLCSFGDCVVRNSILWGVPHRGSMAESVCNSIIESGGGAAANLRALNITDDPMFVDPDNGDFRLRPGSPAIDAGHNDHAPEGGLVDLDGNPRFTDDPGSGDCPHRNSTCGRGPIIDIGAYEFQGDSADAGFSNSLPVVHRVYVDAAATGLATGNSWADAYPSLFDALALAPDGSDIWIAGGTYKPSTDGLDNPRLATFRVGRNLHLIGSFVGNETSVDDRPSGEITTILSGDIGATGDPTDNCYHVVFGSEIYASGTFLDRIAIRDGRADGEAEHSAGAGILTGLGHVRARECEIRSNTAAGDGGGFATYPALGTTRDDPFIEFIGTRFLHNVAAQRGGGIFSNADYGFELLQCIFDGNVAGTGGGMYREFEGFAYLRPPGRIRLTSFTENVAGSFSAAFTSAALDEDGVFDRCVFRQNETTVSGGVLTGIVYGSLFDRNRGAEAIYGPFTSLPPPQLAFCTLNANTVFVGGDAYVCEGKMSTCAYPGHNPDRMRDPGGGDFALMPRSRAIDRDREPFPPGRSLTLPVDHDLAGNPRTVLAPGPGWEPTPAWRPPTAEISTDFGAFEFQGRSLFGDDNGNGEADLQDYAALPACLDGPSAPAADETRVNGSCIDVFGRDYTDRVDLRSFAQFQNVFGPQP